MGGTNKGAKTMTHTIYPNLWNCYKTIKRFQEITPSMETFDFALECFESNELQAAEQLIAGLSSKEQRKLITKECLVAPQYEKTLLPIFMELVVVSGPPSVPIQ
jgi:hypothetical protein